MLMAVVIALVLVAAMAVLVVRQKNMHQWLGAYLRQRLAPARDSSDGPTHILFCFVDHYEPQWNNPDDIDRERARVDRWVRDYPKMASQFVDADGRHPCHSFFYPAEEYRAEHLDKLASLCRDGYGEIEIHLHHDNDTAENLAKDLREFANTLHHQHGALSKDPETGEPVYAFIHGNWCLDNSRPDGRWCGVNNEITVLRDTGCYADFTFPAAPDPSQPPIINSIYHVNDDPEQPCSHFTGKPAMAGAPQESDLLLINGPLMLNWKRRKLGLIPRIENADIRSNNPPTADRVDLWVKAGVRVQGRDDWIFVKIHTHGAQERDMDALLGEPVSRMHRYLSERYNDGERYCLHYVSAREMYNIARAAEAGESGDPSAYRDYHFPRPAFAVRTAAGTSVGQS
jgi:hypothetical protein